MAVTDNKTDLLEKGQRILALCYKLSDLSWNFFEFKGTPNREFESRLLTTLKAFDEWQQDHPDLAAAEIPEKDRAWIKGMLEAFAPPKRSPRVIVAGPDLSRHRNEERPQSAFSDGLSAFVGY